MTEIPVCAHMNLGPFKHVHRRYWSIKNAVDNFQDYLEVFYGAVDKGILERTGADRAPALDLYPKCDQCTDHMNFHDYPMARYVVGPRGGIRKVKV